MPLLISGIVALIAGLILLGFWGSHLLVIIKAAAPLVFLGVGVVLTYLGYEEYRENSRAAQNAAKLFNPEPGPDGQGGEGSLPASTAPVIEVSPDGEAGLSAEDGSAPQGSDEGESSKKPE